MFVFLNACQVGAGQRVLGDYAGLATAFLSAGAAGVVVALWNVHDLAARDVAVNFYRDLDADAVPVAAVLRRIRAQYTRQYADKDAVGRATLLAYQLFGHPDCAYQRSGWRHRLSSHISTWRTPPGRRTRDALSSS
jgi:CHAT domain-containing protein